PAEPARRPHLPADARATARRRRAGAGDQWAPPDGVGAADAPGRRRPLETQPRRHHFRAHPVRLKFRETMTTPATRRIVTCPTCGGESVYSPDNPYRPFCSERCKNVDFGAWATESYRVPAPS